MVDPVPPVRANPELEATSVSEAPDGCGLPPIRRKEESPDKR